MRTSFVLGNEGGAFPSLKNLVRLALSGRIGHGQQGVSWIHIHDCCRIFARAITDQTMRGVFNLTAPHPVSQMTFMAQLRRQMRHILAFPSPEWAVVSALTSWAETPN